MAARKAEEEQQELAKLADLEIESGLTGVAAKQAFFQREARSRSASPVESNEAKIKREAKLRKALKDVKKREEEDAMALLVGFTPEQVQERLREAVEQKLADEQAEKERIEAEELKARADRKTVLNKQWN